LGAALFISFEIDYLPILVAQTPESYDFFLVFYTFLMNCVQKCQNIPSFLLKFEGKIGNEKKK